jgi:D-alanine-D-alanine ligase
VNGKWLVIMNKEKTIGVFFGGKSPEHDISIITGELIISGLIGLGYPVIPVYVDKKGSWFTGEILGDLKVFTQNQSEKFSGLDRIYLDLEASRGKMVLKTKSIINPKIYSIDIAFPAFHGMNGEDGTAQGLFEMFGMPYVGCDVTSSAIAMDKVMTKLLYDASGIPSVPFLYFRFDQWQKSQAEVIKEIKKKLKGNIFVKPARLGSSIGISKTHNAKELEFAMEVAFHYEDKVIVEEAVDDLMDVTCCVIGNDTPQASLLQESAFGKDFFSYEDKYLKDGGAQLGKATQSYVIPARLDKETTHKIQETAKFIYSYIGCSGIARVDFLYDTKKKTFYANELNTMPGTLYNHLWQKSGIELPELLTKLITFAEEKFAAKNRLRYTFESSVLSQAGSAKLSGSKLKNI